MSDKIKIGCLKASLVALFMLFIQVSFAQHKKGAEEPKFPALDEVLERNKKQLGNEFTVTIATPDTIVYQKTVGDMPPKTPTPIGVSSQWLTTALILQLADDGLLSLDDKVSKYLPVFDSYRKGYITIRHCLTHQTGIGTESFKASSLLDKKKYNTDEEEVADIVKKEIHANAGEQFRYSNYGPIIAARIAEIVTKKRFDQIIRNKLFVPLMMRNTSFTTDDGSAPNAANGAKSTATDLARFLQMLLNNGKAGGKQILSEAAVKELRTVEIAGAQVKSAPKVNEGFAFTLGAWAMDGEQGTGDAAGILILPGLNGTLPVVDFLHRYAMVILAKSFSGEQAIGPYKEIKQVADQQPLTKNKTKGRII